MTHFIQERGFLFDLDGGKGENQNKLGRWVFFVGEKYLTLPSDISPSNPNQQHYITRKEFITNLNQPTPPKQVSSSSVSQ